MLTIRKAQVQALDQAAARTLEKEILDHVKLAFPADFALLGEDGARTTVREGVLRARNYGLAAAPGAGAFVDLMFLLGTGFDAAPMLPDARRVLDDSSRDEDLRAQDLSRLAQDYRDRVEGPGHKHLKGAIQRFLTQHITAAPYSDNLIKTPLIINLKLLYPEKCEFLGEAGLSALVADALESGRVFGLTQLGALQAYTRAILMLGRGFHLDPRWATTAKVLEEDANQLLKAEALHEEVAGILEKRLRGLEVRPS